jgi:hypothetical protein
MAKIKSLGTKPMDQSLSLLRQLKYAENVIFAGRDPYASSPSSSSSGSSSPSTTPSPSGRHRSHVAPGSSGISSNQNSNSRVPDDRLSHADVEMILLDLL